MENERGVSPTLLGEILMSLSPALITEEQELPIVHLLRNMFVRPAEPRIDEAGKRVNVFKPSSSMVVEFGPTFTFAPLFSILSHPQAARLSALIIAYAYDPRTVYCYFLANQSTMSSVPFCAMHEAVRQGFRFAHMRRSAHVVALYELWDEGRIVCVDKESPVLMFLEMFKRVGKDLRMNVLLKYACTNEPIRDVGEMAVCMDTVRAWMRCDVLERKEGKIFIHYQNWTNKWDEWLTESDSTRVQPWVNPSIVAFNPLIPRRHVLVAKWEVMRLLRTGAWALQNPHFAAPEDGPIAIEKEEYKEENQWTVNFRRA
jgi:hypothetical protein